MRQIFWGMAPVALLLAVVYFQHDNSKYRRARRYPARHLAPKPKPEAKPDNRGRHRSADQALGPFAPDLASRAAAAV